MHINSYEKRLEAPVFGGFPQPTLLLGALAFVTLAFAIVLPVLPVKILFGGFSVGAFGVAGYIWLIYDDWLIWRSNLMGKKMKKAVSLGAEKQFSYCDGFSWKTHLDDNYIAHAGDVVSVAFTWNGIHDRYFCPEEHTVELMRRIALLRSLPTDCGLVIENHLIRVADDRLVDAYLEAGESGFKGKEMPPIVRDIRQQLAAMYRPLARSNRVLTVLSIGKGLDGTFFGFLKNTAIQRHRGQKNLHEQLRAQVQSLQGDYRGLRVLDKNEYQRVIQKLQQPYDEPHAVDWRFNLAEQMAITKPVWAEGCLKINNTYAACMLVQIYPDLVPGWVHKFVEAPIDLHVCQIIAPKAVGEALDKSREQSGIEQATISEKKGAEFAQSKMSDAAKYRHYVADLCLPVADNAYIVTITSKNRDTTLRFAERFKRDVVAFNNGLVRDNEDLQHELFRIRLPGMGRSSHYWREDHGHTVAAMMPYTTFSHGVDNPESLRISSSGQLVGFSPSKLSVPHGLIVAEMGGGKDTEMGTRFIETYSLIWYCIIELGNSYQGAIEAVGGRYCRAREQVINPLPSYDEYHGAKAMAAAGAGNLDADFIIAQTIIMTPIINGMKGSPFTRSQESVMQKALRHIYENPVSGKEAPVLPYVLEALPGVEAKSQDQEDAKKYLHAHLFEFLDSETGKSFCKEDQFVISPIANGIDFDKFSGELFDFYMTFISTRFVTNAMSRGARSEIVLNEYKVLIERAPEAIRWITLTLDRMGRKDWTGLTRITQGMTELETFDKDALDAMPNRMLLARRRGHQDIGKTLEIPDGMTAEWASFPSTDVMDQKGYREAITCQLGEWHRLYLKFPQLCLDLMNTRAEDKLARDEAYRQSSDPYERIAIRKQIISQQKGVSSETDKQQAALI